MYTVYMKFLTWVFLCFPELCCINGSRIWQPQSETLRFSQRHLFTGEQVHLTGPVMAYWYFIYSSPQSKALFLRGIFVMLMFFVNICDILVCTQTISSFESSSRRRAMWQWGGLRLHDSLLSSHRGTTRWGAFTGAKTPTASASVSTPSTSPTLCTQLAVFKHPVNPPPAYQENTEGLFIWGVTCWYCWLLQALTSHWRWTYRLWSHVQHPGPVTTSQRFRYFFILDLFNPVLPPSEWTFSSTSVFQY